MWQATSNLPLCSWVGSLGSNLQGNALTGHETGQPVKQQQTKILKLGAD